MNKIILPNKSQEIEFPKWTADFYDYSNGSTSQEVPSSVMNKDLKDEKTAFELFKSELDVNCGTLRREGLFFGCKSDPFLPETFNFYIEVIKHCLRKEVPVMALTKQAWFTLKPFPFIGTNVAVGFSLNPIDEHETCTATIKERISALAFLHNRRTRTFINMDQIADLEFSLELIELSTRYSDLSLLGISAGETFSLAGLRRFYEDVLRYKASESKIYWNSSILEELYINRCELVKTGRLGEYSGHNVDRDFSLFWDLYR